MILIVGFMVASSQLSLDRSIVSCLFAVLTNVEQ